MAKIIPTTYSGVKFRSRLEARWAVVFDTLKIRWVYEPEAFELADGSGYTPDFLLPVFSHGVYVEVRPDGDAFAVPRRFCAEHGHRIWLLAGEPRPVTTAFLERVTCPDCSDHPGAICRPPEVEEHDVIPLIGRRDLYFDSGVPVGCDFLPWYGDLAPHLLHAFERARGYRFWDPRTEAR